MTKPSQSEISEDLQKELRAQQKFEWLQHPETQRLIKELKEKREKLLVEIENLSLHIPRCNDTIHNKLVESITIRKQIETYGNYRK